MIRLIVLLLVFTEIGFAQNQMTRLTYEQIVTKKSTGEKLSKEVDGILSSL